VFQESLRYSGIGSTYSSHGHVQSSIHVTCSRYTTAIPPSTQSAIRWGSTSHLSKGQGGREGGKVVGTHLVSSNQPRMTNAIRCLEVLICGRSSSYAGVHCCMYDGGGVSWSHRQAVIERLGLVKWCCHVAVVVRVC
jgi:hypothetical protein